MERGKSLQLMVLGELESHVQKNKTRLIFDALCKINLKWMKYLNIRSETIQYVDENIGTKLKNLGLNEAKWGKIFADNASDKELRSKICK